MVNKRTSWQYIKDYKFNSLIIKYFLIISCIIIVPFSIISYFNINNMKQIIKNEIKASVLTSLSSSKNSIDNLIRQADVLATNMSLQRNINLFMYSSEDSELLEGNYEKIKEYISLNGIIFHYIDSIYVYSEKNQKIVSKNDAASLADFSDISWIADFEQINNDEIRLVSRKKQNSGKSCITLIKPVWMDVKNRIGAVIINIDPKELTRLTKNNNSLNDEFMMVSNSGDILYSYDTSILGLSTGLLEHIDKVLKSDEASPIEILAGNEQATAMMLKSAFYDAKFIYMFPIANYQYKMGGITTLNVGIIIFCAFLCLILSMFLAFRVFRPIGEIISIIDNPKSFSETEPLYNKNTEEIKYILKNIAQTISSHEEIKIELEQRLVLLNKAHYSMLQAQVNPHFLFNTLETIKWIAFDLTNSENRASSAILSLSKLFRSNYATEEFLTSFSDEIEHAKLYVEILKLRHDDKFDVVWNIDDEILKCKTIKLCLQPLIENAVYHGINPKKAFGTVKIEGKKTKDKIEIKIMDDGVGIPKPAVRKLNQRLSRKYDFTGMHIGVTNVNQRIKIIWGENYGIKISSVEKQGTTVTIIIPVIAM